jgi:hypothetical protein
VTSHSLLGDTFLRKARRVLDVPEIEAVLEAQRDRIGHEEPYADQRREDELGPEVEVGALDVLDDGHTEAAPDIRRETVPGLAAHEIEVDGPVEPDHVVVDRSGKALALRLGRDRRSIDRAGRSRTRR